MALLFLLLGISLLVNLSLLVFFYPKTVKVSTPSPILAIVLLPIIAGLGLCVTGIFIISHESPQWIDNVKGIGLVPSGSDFVVFNATHRFGINLESLVLTLQQFAANRGFDTDLGVEFSSQKLVQMLQLSSLSPSTIHDEFADSVTSKNSDGPTVIAGGVALVAIGVGLCAKVCK